MESTFSFGYWMQQRRKALDLTQKSLADVVGCATVTIRKIERDERRPSRELAALLADRLEIPDEHRQSFVKCARGLLPVDRLPLLESPTGRSSQPFVAPAAEPARKHNLPAQTTPFIGRERQITEVTQLLENARLVTLVGPGGTGKTRLALQVAETTADRYADGAVFVSLASIREPALVPSAMAEEIGLVEQPNAPLVESLQYALGDKRLLLVVDNLEHVLEAAPVLAELLAASPGLTILATSREVLRLSGEHEYLVPPLSVPDPSQEMTAVELSPADSSPAEPTACESVILFVQRARAASPAFRLTDDNALAVAGICARLDGLPLAIELAAPRVKLLEPQQMLERLESRLEVLARGSRDLPARQRTLRDTLDWSYDLLDEEERRLFARLAAFTGGRSLAAVEAVCGSGLHIDPLDGLESLLNKSLLYRERGPGEEPRFMMLETVHEYARERLSDSGDEPHIRKRHLAYFLSLAEEMGSSYRRQDQLLLLKQTAIEMDNLRAAFNWAMENEQIEAAARLVAALDYLFKYKGPLVEGYRLIGRVLAKLEELPQELQIRLLLAAGRLAWLNEQGSGQSISFLRRVLALSRARDDQSSLAWAQVELAALSTGSLEDYEKAVALCEDGLAVFRELGDRSGEAYGLNILGELARFTGDYSQARKAYEASLVIFDETGESVRGPIVLLNLALLAYDEGDYARARGYATSNMRQAAETGWNQWFASGLAVLAGPVGKLGEPEKAARLLGASAAITRETVAFYQPQDQPIFAKYIAAVQDLLDEETFALAWAEGEAMTPEQAVAYALDG